MSSFAPKSELRGVDENPVGLKRYPHLKKNLEKVMKTEGAIEPTHPEYFGPYVFNKQPRDIIELKWGLMYNAWGHRWVEDKVSPVYGAPMIACDIKKEMKIKPVDLWLKLLRFLAKNNTTHFVETLDIFTNERSVTYAEKHEIWEDYKEATTKVNIILIQERAHHGSGLSLIRSGFICSEMQIRAFTKQLYKALEYLLRYGICHRALHPKSILIFQNAASEFHVKLGGLKYAIAYWDSEKNAIINQRCRDIENFKEGLQDYQPFEVWGTEMDTFQPVVADIWSLGACLYALHQHEYPHDETAVNDQMNNPLSHTPMSNSFKTFLRGLLSFDQQERTKWEKIAADAWFEGSTN